MIGVAPIPDSLGGLSNLTLLWLAYNDLHGCIQASVHRLRLAEAPLQKRPGGAPRISNKRR